MVLPLSRPALAIRIAAGIPDAGDHLLPSSRDLSRGIPECSAIQSVYPSHHASQMRAKVSRGTRTEAVILMAHDDAAREEAKSVKADRFLRAAEDYFPSRDVELLEYMELLAVFEASSRRLLPAKYAGMTSEDLDLRLRTLRAAVGSRR